MNREIKKWFYLEPYTFIWRKEDNFIIYNSLSGENYVFISCVENHSFFEKLLDINNLTTLPLTEEDLCNSHIIKELNRIRELVAGNTLNYRPTIIPPLLNLQQDVERLRKDKQRTVGERVLTNLYQIDIKLVAESVNDKYLDSLKSFIAPVFTNSNARISIYGFENLNNEQLNSIYGKLELDKSCNIKTIFLPFNLSLETIQNLPFTLFDNIQIKIQINNQIDHFSYNYMKSLLTSDFAIEWEFVVCSEEEYFRIEQFISLHNLSNVTLRPHYNGKNLDFFETFIYLTKEDLRFSNLPRREVFAHQVINTNDFGKLCVMPDGTVYANPLFSSIGRIDSDIRELIYKEMDKGTSWRRIRSMEPCSKCVYQWLCPSPSDYEIAIGKPNLCHVHP